jgi:hypothetical protein
MNFVTHNQGPCSSVVSPPFLVVSEAVDKPQIQRSRDGPHDIGVFYQFLFWPIRGVHDRIWRTQYDCCTCVLTLLDDFSHIRLVSLQRYASHIVHPKHHNHQMRLPSDNVCLDPSQRVLRRVATDTSVDHFQIGVRVGLLQREPQHITPGAQSTAVIINSRDTVAETDNSSQPAISKSLINFGHGGWRV